ncbi:MAG: hypothetical protein U0836_20150 [Pirellulales bacterium]
MPLCETITDLDASAARIAARRYGVIHTAGGRFEHLRLRPFPKWSTVADVHLFGRRRHERLPGDRCWLYYNQPWGHERFLALTFVVSSREGTLATFRRALTVLDEIARIKQSDALLCDACNLRISDRLLRRWGWAAHKPGSRRRHFIKRFYGVYPQTEPLAESPALECVGTP